MCGIFFSVSHGKALKPDELTLVALKARGPDAINTVTVPVETAIDGALQEKTYFLHFCSSVLALRGDRVQAQPLLDPASGSVFCWNGEAWNYDGHRVLGNDTATIFEQLVSYTKELAPATGVVEVLSKISGPFAFVFYHAPSRVVYFGRDRLGRRSLIVEKRDRQTLTVCSIPSETIQNAAEVDTTLLHSVAVRAGSIDLQSFPQPTAPLSINHDLPITTISTKPSFEAIDLLVQHLSTSLRLRVLQIPDHASQARRISQTKVAILFSGGLDCTLLARVVHDILPLSESIDLLNVAFENPRSLQNLSNVASPYELCPDRLTGRSSSAILLSTCSHRTWRFVAVNVPYEMLLAHRPTITSLLRPHNTEMDLSIASALYFASRGTGEAILSAEAVSPQPYTSPARILLSGLGADELFGGYARHAAAFNRSSYSGLIDELNLDITRIGQRNLGRDDRVMSHWGKEVRYPYLDEDFVEWSLGLPVWEKTGFREGLKLPKHFDGAGREKAEVNGERDLPPDKMLLRLAAWKLGLKGVAAEKKRAIQFGARTAKMEIGKGRMKGTDVVGD